MQLRVQPDLVPKVIGELRKVIADTAELGIAEMLMLLLILLPRFLRREDRAALGFGIDVQERDREKDHVHLRKQRLHVFRELHAVRALGVNRHIGDRTVRGTGVGETGALSLERLIHFLSVPDHGDNSRTGSRGAGRDSGGSGGGKGDRAPARESLLHSFSFFSSGYLRGKPELHTSFPVSQIFNLMSARYGKTLSFTG